MDQCKKHDDQMREWIMSLKVAKEIWDAAFLQNNSRYELHLDASIIFDLAKEIYHERMGRRDTVLHKEDSPEYKDDPGSKTTVTDRW